MSRPLDVKVGPLPSWLDWKRLLGPGLWETAQTDDCTLEARASLERNAAADLAARLRGVGIGGEMISFASSPPLQRKDLRKALTEEARRYRKSSKGFTRPSIRIDAEGRYSLTPEVLAHDLGKRAQSRRVVDACAGAGGNAIGFARAGCEVIAIELDPSRLAMAKHNAKIYGVGERIRFICGDAREIISQLEADLLFVDPPWGEKYNKQRVNLKDLEPCEQILDHADHIQRIWIKTPPSFDPDTLPGYRPEAVFGKAPGDERRVKFLLLEKAVGNTI
jgi:16S rRNA G966 N2-methylase RsmD